MDGEQGIRDAGAAARPETVAEALSQGPQHYPTVDADRIRATFEGGSSPITAPWAARPMKNRRRRCRPNF